MAQSSGMQGNTVSPADVRAMLKDGGELALIDVREEGVFSEEGHPLGEELLKLVADKGGRAKIGKMARSKLALAEQG